MPEENLDAIDEILDEEDINNSNSELEEQEQQYQEEEETEEASSEEQASSIIITVDAKEAKAISTEAKIVLENDQNVLLTNEILKAANLGLTNITWKQELTENTINLLEEKGYVITTNENEYIISWENASMSQQFNKISWAEIVNLINYINYTIEPIYSEETNENLLYYKIIPNNINSEETIIDEDDISEDDWEEIEEEIDYTEEDTVEDDDTEEEISEEEEEEEETNENENNGEGEGTEE